MIGQALGSRGLEMNPARTGAVVTIANDLYFVPFGASDRAQRLTSTMEDEEEFTFSPDGSWSASCAATTSTSSTSSTGRERRLTTDGGPQLLNGKLDWVYQEEIYGRGNYRAYWWSPDSQRLAFLRLDETHGARVHRRRRHPAPPEGRGVPYPKAGDPNPAVKLGVVERGGGAPRVGRPATATRRADILIVDVGWTPDGSRVVYQVQDREQTWLDLNMADAATARRKTLLRETTKAWVERRRTARTGSRTARSCGSASAPAGSTSTTTRATASCCGR